MSKTTTSIAINFNDRYNRRLVLYLNNDQRYVIGAWVEENPKATYDESLSNTQLYELLSKRES